MLSDKKETAEKKIKRVTYIGMFLNGVLSFVKIAIGYLAGSLSLVADGVHSFSDIATDLAVLLGIRLGSKKADSSHPYGHGRAETFAGGFVAMILIIVGGAMIIYATKAIARDEATKPNLAVLIAAILSVLSKEWLYRITKKIAVESHSPSVYANAWHHRSDALSSVAVVIGFIALEFGFTHGDQVAAIAVGLMIVLVGIKIISDTFRELTESSTDSETIELIKNIINSNPSIHQWHNLRSRSVGREVFLDVHILVDPELNVPAAHEISENLENSIEQQVSRPVNITVHIEPDTPEMRK
ncbi:MAG: cation transporter [Sedimentisphaerales bacterium]|nr:cation transporter [Sedimentisphaerales bacterium]